MSRTQTDDAPNAPTGEPEEDSRRRSVYVRSYGCQMNVYDSGRMTDTLVASGYVEADAPETADLVILNTCHIREKAADKVYSELGKLRIMKAERGSRGRTMQIAVAGCVAQAEGAEIVRRQPAVDLVVGPQNYHRLTELLGRATHSPGVVDTAFPVEDKFDHLPEAPAQRLKSRGVSAFVTVQEGCDKFCTFCVVPYTRGAEMSRPVGAILTEISSLAEAGVRELTLLGQNVNAYHGLDEAGRSVSLAALIERIATIPGVERIRYTTSHPRDMTDDLIAAHRDIPALMPYLHLPVQSGSDQILDAMNRKHTAQEYLRLAERIRRARPDIAFSSDFIVGFPEETEEDFRATMRLVSEVGFASAYSFKYSPRPGTPASKTAAQVPEEVKKQRLAALQQLLEEQRQAFNRRACGLELPVLFEKPGRRAGQIAGKTPYLQAVHVEGSSELIGETRLVRILETGSNSLSGKLVDRFAPQQARTLP